MFLAFGAFLTALYVLVPPVKGSPLVINGLGVYGLLAMIASGLASAVLSLGETFELEVVAEGIEYPEQSATLRELGCDTGQGFYFARPMEPGRLVSFLTERTDAAEGTALPAGSD